MRDTARLSVTRWPTPSSSVKDVDTPTMKECVGVSDIDLMSPPEVLDRIQSEITIEMDARSMKSTNWLLGQHWSKKQQYAKEWRQRAGDVWAAKMGELDIAYILTPCIVISEPIRYRGKLIDWDNQSLTVKPIVDGAVDAGLIPDDGTKHVIGGNYRSMRRPTRWERLELPPDVILVTLKSVTEEEAKKYLGG